MKEKRNLRLNNQSQTMGTKRFLYRTFLFFALCANVLFVSRARNNTCSSTGQTGFQPKKNWPIGSIIIGKVLNSWPKWQVLFREHYINCNVYWLQTCGHTVYISSPDLYFTFLTLYVWCAAWWDLRMNTLTNLISFTLWSFLPFIEYYF